MEKIIVGLMIVVAVAFLIARIYRSVRSGGCCSGGCSCDDKNSREKGC